ARASRVNTPTVTPRAQRPLASDAPPVPRVVRPPASAVRPSRPRPEAAEARAAPQDEGLMDPPSELQTQRFRARPVRGSARPSRQAEEDVAEAPPEPRPAREGSGWGMRLFLLLLLGGVGYLLTLEPVRRLFMPAVDSAKQWVKAEMDPAPPVDPAANGQWPPKPSGPPPGFAQKTAPEPEKAPVEEPPPTPEPVVGTTPADTQKTPAGKGGRKTKPAPTAPAATTDKPALAKAEPRPAKPEPSERPPEPVTTVTQTENPEVLDTSTPQGAAKAGLGWLTIYTVPKNAAVFDGATQLGTSPLTRFPLPIGTYRLRVVDPQDPGGTSKLLSAPIRPGEVTKLQIRLADLPAYSD
ncbi:serine/threonine protein kinase, partial [Corallococcus aberystwythensis]